MTQMFEEPQGVGWCDPETMKPQGQKSDHAVGGR